MLAKEEIVKAQRTQLQDLRNEMSRLDARFDDQLKKLGMTCEDLRPQEYVIPDFAKKLAEARDRTRREGEARAAQ